MGFGLGLLMDLKGPQQPKHPRLRVFFLGRSNGSLPKFRRKVKSLRLKMLYRVKTKAGPLCTLRVNIDKQTNWNHEHRPYGVFDKTNLPMRLWTGSSRFRLQSVTGEAAGSTDTSRWSARRRSPPTCSAG